MGRGSETKLQVGENLYQIILVGIKLLKSGFKLTPYSQNTRYFWVVDLPVGTGAVASSDTPANIRHPEKGTILPRYLEMTGNIM